MSTFEVSVARKGKAGWILLSAEVLRGYRVGESLMMELRPNEIALWPRRSRKRKLTWKQTYKQMAEADENWGDWEAMP